MTLCPNNPTRNQKPKGYQKPKGEPEKACAEQANQEPSAIDRPTPTSAILAKCHDCCGFYLDGKLDCQNRSCSLYYWMPYRRAMPTYTWQEHSPRQLGKVKWSTLNTPARIAAAQKALQVRQSKVKNENK